MPRFAKIKQLWKATVTAGDTKTEEWTADENYILHQVLFIEETGAELYKSQVTIRIDNNVLTIEKCSAYIFNHDRRKSPILDVPFEKDHKITVSLENLEGADKTIECDLILYYPD